MPGPLPRMHSGPTGSGQREALVGRGPFPLSLGALAPPPKAGWGVGVPVECSGAARSVRREIHGPVKVGEGPRVHMQP